MSLAARSAGLAALLGVVVALVAMANEGATLTTLAAIGGIAIFAFGLLLGHGGMAVSGLCMTGLSAALSTDSSGLGIVELVGIGLAVCVALLATDVSWWSRRQAEVEPAVLTAIAKAALPAWVFGAAAAVGVRWLATRSEWTIWLLPTAIVVTGAIIAVISEATRRRLSRTP